MFKKRDFVFTSESVSEGHPDKVCDRISDAIVDMFLTKDADARVACEALATTNRVILAGEMRCPEQISQLDMEATVRRVVRDIGYEQYGFHWKDIEISNYMHNQSADIAMGVDASEDKDEGAGDQGIMFGYACSETDCFMPAPIYYAHNILQNLADLRHSGDVAGLRPDSKSQVTLVYKDGKPIGAKSIVVSTQHAPELEIPELKKIIRDVVAHTLPEGWMCPDEEFYVNPTGRFVIGGPDGDAGLTGRKIIVDTYGGAAPHGGGAFSGKDSTKVDRSAAYASRYLAKNVVAAGLSRRCSIQLSYAIGVSKPLSVYVNLHGTAAEGVKEDVLADVLQEVFDLSPRGIREALDLKKPIYERTAAYGHFGREPDADGGFSWEKLDLVESLKSAF
ncbi:MAG: methionine adenosyltransferase [Alphaproteobacteria bacterium]